jgi:hypothetical protein
MTERERVIGLYWLIDAYGKLPREELDSPIDDDDAAFSCLSSYTIATNILVTIQLGNQMIISE